MTLKLNQLFKLMAGESNFENIENNKVADGVMELYPVARLNQLKLPRVFRGGFSKSYLQVTNDDEFQDIRNSKDSNCDSFSTLKADCPIPCCCGIYYFEIRLVSNETLGFIGLGIGNTNMDESLHLGKESNSVGLYLVNGRSVSLWIADKEFPIAISEKTRVNNLGIGINFIENYVFCTVNGMLLLRMKELPPKEKFPIDSLYPAVSSQSPKCSFSVNLGHDLTKLPFSYNFQDFKTNELKKKRNKCLSQEYSPNLAFVTVYNLVSDYLLHHGFAEAWEALNKYDDSQSKDQSLETIKNRRLIQKCILNEDFLGAIKNIKNNFPDFFNQFPIYKFILKCRHFINLIIKKPLFSGSNDDQDDCVTSPKSAKLDPLLIKRKNKSLVAGVKIQAVVAMDVTRDCINNKENGIECEISEENSLFNLDNTYEDEKMEMDSVVDGDVDLKNINGNANSSSILAGEHVMYIIQYGKKLKEKAQVFYRAAESDGDYKHGVELLTTAFSLIAYRDPYNSPFKEILGPKHMEDLAHKINGAINGMLGKTTRARLDSLLDYCLSETQQNSKNSPILASIHPKLLVSELFIEDK